ncbi:hypothetical protein [Ornithinibacillus halotolerans]|uniref:Uncharacterized protein n=1 Tax=Ornithinibacillus halotolerans TaxID=1274357 RepID=A0A916RZR5_9BACI|nr:hypothetical protein [Ornithinibacillus halotolerans]GGA74935.1 hypothetical protein GCM10008025_18310 [Ornithinibacillus halotolerans]
MRNIRFSEKLLLLGYCFILLFMIVQDWVPLGTLNDITAIQQEKTKSELINVTLIGVIQITLLISIILLFIGKKYPLFIKLWLIIHPSCIFIGILMSWYIPYLTGIGAAEKVESYTAMFGNTHAFLPVMNGIVPNTLHVLFHIILLLCIIIAIYIAITTPNRENIQRG